jgi:hypothetical protein
MKRLGVASHLANYTCDVTIINYQPFSTIGICPVHHIVLWFKALLLTWVISYEMHTLATLRK